MTNNCPHHINHFNFVKYNENIIEKIILNSNWNILYYDNTDIIMNYTEGN